MNKRTLALTLSLSLIVAILAGVAGGYLFMKSHAPTASPMDLLDGDTSQSDSVDQTKRAANIGALPYFIHAAEVATPAVVHVRTQSIIESQSPYRGSILEFFFGPQPNVQRPVRSSGSGAIVSDDGFIVTNYHVIKGAQQIEVSLPDKRTYKAKIIAGDPTTDLAMLKINASNKLPYIEFGHSEALRVGEWVLAIGNPFDLETTVTAGIVSAKARNINIQSGQVAIESFIQVDAAVNPGNSGGPLVDLDGKLVGINTAIASPTGAFAGYAFSIPEVIVRKFVEDIKSHGRVKRVYLGVNLVDMNQQIANQLTNGDTRGVLITRVLPNTPAAKAGLKSSDVILAIDGKKVNSVSKVQEIIGSLPEGAKAIIKIARHGKIHELEVYFHDELE